MFKVISRFVVAVLVSLAIIVPASAGEYGNRGQNNSSIWFGFNNGGFSVQLNSTPRVARPSYDYYEYSNHSPSDNYYNQRQAKPHTPSRLSGSGERILSGDYCPYRLAYQNGYYYCVR